MAMTRNERLNSLRRRREQRGAAVFIVVMVITLLTSVGIYAAYSTTLVDQASGHARQALQTQYVAEYGALSVSAELGSGAASVYLNQMASGTEDCRATRDLSGNPPCQKIFMTELSGNVPSGAKLLEPASQTEPGSLGGPVNLAGADSFGLQGNFVVEMTDPQSGMPVVGTDVGGTGPKFDYVEVTLSSIGQVLPTAEANLANCDADAAAVAGTQQLRSHVVVGPIPR